MEVDGPRAGLADVPLRNDLRSQREDGLATFHEWSGIVGLMQASWGGSALRLTFLGRLVSVGLGTSDVVGNVGGLFLFFAAVAVTGRDGVASEDVLKLQV